MSVQFTRENAVDYGMQTAITLLHPIILPNNQADLQGIYFDMENFVALAGFRRTVANFGTLLVKAHYKPGAQVRLGDGDYRTDSGVYNVMSKMYHPEQYGLMGGEGADGKPEVVNNEIATDKINDVLEQVALHHKVGLSPNAIYKFLVNVIKRGGKYGHLDRKVNIQFSPRSAPKGMYMARAILTKDKEFRLITKVGEKEVVMEVSPNSIIKERPVKKNGKLIHDGLVDGMVYLFKPEKLRNPDKPEARYCNVHQPFIAGIRLAVQHIENGVLKPDGLGYVVNPSKGVDGKSIADMPFLRGQNTTVIKGAPMLTIDLDNFFALFDVLKAYPVVELSFKDSSTGLHFFAKGPNEYLPDIEAIMSPTIQYVRGKVCLP